MTIKNVVVEIRSLKSVLYEAAEVMGRAKRGENVTPKFGIGFESIEGFRKAFTGKRLELLKIIKERAPESVYELARIAGRNLKSVNTDLKVLKEYDLVKLRKSINGRAKVKPEVDFDKLTIEIPLGESQKTYNVEPAKQAYVI